jgi:hypothetical protein
MRRTLCFGLALLLAASVPLAARQKPTAADVYREWRGEKLARKPQGLQTRHYALAAVAERLDAARARVEFYAVGRMSGVDLEIQPLKGGKRRRGDAARELTGEKTLASLKGGDGSEVTPASLTVIVPVTKETDTVEVKWTVSGGDLALSNTVTVPLKVGYSKAMSAVTY